MLIGVTDTLRGQDALERYLGWLRKNLRETELVVLSYLQDNAAAVDRCSGVVMTGGGDVDPRLYGAADALSLTSEVDEERDSFEIGLVRRTQERGIPVLGICRGLQITNVAFGGTLVPDLRQAGFDDHRKTPEGDRRHAVRLSEGSLLGDIGGGVDGGVNSSHHQAVDRPGVGLRVTARSADGVVEGVERDGPGPFLLLVQWHPERMVDAGNPLAAGVIAAFRNGILGAAPT